MFTTFKNKLSHCRLNGIVYLKRKENKKKRIVRQNKEGIKRRKAGFVALTL